MALNPSYDDAYKIVKLYWEDNLSKKEAVIHSGVYTQKSAINNWTKVWEQDDSGNYVCPNINKAFQDFEERVVPFVKRRIPQLVDEYMKLCRTSPDPAERRRAIEFILETVGDFVKGKKLDIEMRNKFMDMGPEEFLEYLESMPGVSIKKEEFFAGLFG